MYIIGDWEPGSFIRFRLNNTGNSINTTTSSTATEPSLKSIHLPNYGFNVL